MRYPFLKPIPENRTFTDVFGGYNHRLRIGDGEFYDMKNFSSSFYPVLATRQSRGTLLSFEGESKASANSLEELIKPEYPDVASIDGMVSKDGLWYVRSGVLYHRATDGKTEAIEGLELNANEKKKLVVMGAYIIILPDKKYVNTVKKEDGAYESGDVEKSFTSEYGSYAVTFYLSDGEGNTYSVSYKSSSAPENPENGKLWLDTTDAEYRLKKYSADSEMWAELDTYIMIRSNGIDEGFFSGDSIRISGITEGYLTFLNNSPTVIRKVGKGYILVPGAPTQTDGTTNGTGYGYYYQHTAITVKRAMPEMDFVIESGNRLWGCRYGKNVDGDFVNEIYASKLGDFKNWSCYEGIASDSYAASVGTDGPFTGAISYQSYPIFFKENCMHKVYGSYPANYQLQSMTCRGVQAGCDKSLAIVNEVLFYKSRGGICAYDGSLPADVSACFGDVTYESAVAGGQKNKYYVSMKGVSDGKYHMFVYDASYGMWHKEDEVRADGFVLCGSDLYYIESKDTERVYTDEDMVNGTKSVTVTRKRQRSIRSIEGEDEAEIPFMLETGLIGLDEPDKKYLSRLDVRLSCTLGTRLTISVEYDSSGHFEALHTLTASNVRSFTIPVRPRRCDHLRLRIEGKGQVRIYSISKTQSVS